MLTIKCVSDVQCFLDKLCLTNCCTKTQLMKLCMPLSSDMLVCLYTAAPGMLHIMSISYRFWGTCCLPIQILCIVPFTRRRSKLVEILAKNLIEREMHYYYYYCYYYYYYYYYYYHYYHYYYYYYNYYYYYSYYYYY